jgi:SAM-dependent methyltransferase
MKKEIIDNYSALALIYDHVMRHVDYVRWGRYIYLITKKYCAKESPVLELSSGNCKLTSILKRYYPQLIATDLSLHMLKICNDKNLKKVCCDMRSIPFKNKFNLIISTFDSVNYILTKRGLLKLFLEVEKILHDEGLFCFDVSLENNSLLPEKEFSYSGSYKGIRYKRSSNYNGRNRIHSTKFQIDLMGERVNEVHMQKIFKFEDYFEILERAGLYAVSCFNQFSIEPGSPDSKRVQFILKKRKNAFNF